MINNIIKNKVIFISGKITGDKDYENKFKAAEKILKLFGFIVLNPIFIPKHLAYEKQMNICFNYIDNSDYVYMLKDHRQSKGSTRELHYALSKDKIILFEED